MEMKAFDSITNFQEIFSNAIGQQRQLENMREQIDRLTGAITPSKIHADIEKALAYQQDFEIIRNQLEDISGKSAYEKIIKESLKFSPEISAIQKLHESLENNLFGSYLDKIQDQLNTADPYWLSLQKSSIFDMELHKLNSATERMLSSGVLPDTTGITGFGLFSGQIKNFLDPAIGVGAAYEQILRSALGPAFGPNGLQDILGALQAPTYELKQEVEKAGRKLTSEALTEASPEGALRKFLASLQGIDPLKQFFLIGIFCPIFVGVVLSVVNPVSDHYIKKWLADSPQGAEKQAEARVVEEAGGKTVLADYRLVVANPSLIVRETPAALGKKMGNLVFGTAVRAVKEEDAFTFVEWRGEGDSIMAGWVFTRYLKKFK